MWVTDTPAYFCLTEPPLDLLPASSRQAVQDAFHWIRTDGVVDRLINSEPDSTETVRTRVDRATETLRALAIDPIVAWLVLTELGSLIIKEVGLPPDGFWELPSEIFPPAEDLAEEAMHNTPVEMRPDPVMIGNLFRDVIRYCTGEILIDICANRAPAPPRMPHDDQEQFWMLRALVVVLLTLRHENRNLMTSVSAVPAYHADDEIDTCE